MKYLIVGSGTAGTRAALEIRKRDRKSEITVVSDSKYPEFSPCALPFVLHGKIKSFDEIIIRPLEFYKKIAKVDLRLGEKVLKVGDGNAETEKGTLQFDKCLIATGARPFIPPIPGTEFTNVSDLVTIDDGKKIRAEMKSAKTAVIIGGGLIGLELADALSSNKIDTTVVEILPQVFSGLDTDLAGMVQKSLEGAGIKFRLGEKVTGIEGKGKAEKVLTEKGTLPADLVIIATGVRPNTEIAKESGIGLGETGAIKTNDYLETSKKNIYAAGNCIEAKEFFTGKPVPNNLGTAAERQGLVAAFNMSGEKQELRPALNSTIIRLGDIEVGRVGITTALAEKFGLKVKSAKFTGAHLPEYYPGGEDITVKLLSDEKGLLVGAQFAGAGVLERIEALTFGMQKGMTAEELAFAEMPYTPPLCPTIDPIRVAATLLMRK